MSLKLYLVGPGLARIAGLEVIVVLESLIVEFNH